MNDIIEKYILYLIRQYYEKPKANAEVRMLLGEWQLIADFLRDFGNEFDLDNAHSRTLDIIGRIVDLPRQVNAVIPEYYFGFSENPNAAGFGLAPFFRIGESTATPYQLNDAEYSRFLRIKIAKNNSTPFLASDERESLQQVAVNAFDGMAYIDDNKNQTLTLYVSPDVDDITLSLVLQLDILPRPATFSYNVVIQADPRDTFGFAENPNALGFDSAPFARIYNV